MELMGLVGVMVNCALIGLSGQVDRMFPNITTNQTILLIILLEVRCSNYCTYTSALLVHKLPAIALNRANVRDLCPNVRVPRSTFCWR